MGVARTSRQTGFAFYGQLIHGEEKREDNSRALLVGHANLVDTASLR